MGKNKNIPKVKQTNDSLPKKQKETRNQLVNELFKVSSMMTEYISPMAQFEKTKEILQILEKLRKVEKEVYFPTYKREEHFESFIKWFTENGGVLDGVEISHFDEGVGLICRKALKVGDKVIAVPTSIIMSTDNVQGSPLGIFAKNDDLVASMQNIFLALHLLNEYFDEDSKWLPYVKVLPSEFDLVLNFTEDQILRLKGSSVFERAINLIKSIARQYAYLYTKFVLSDECANSMVSKYFTYDAYRWAVSCVMTRMNILPMGDESHFALTPVWDLANHNNAPISTDMDVLKSELICFASQDFVEGDQFYIFYGQRSNVEFFLNNGFIINPNPYDTVIIKLGISRSDPFFDKKTHLLTNLDIHHHGNFSITNKAKPISADLLAFIRVINLGEDGLRYWHDNLRSLNNLADSKFRQDRNAELKTKQFILARIRLLLSAYNTPIDDNQPSEEKSDIDKRICELLEIEKNIFAGAIKFFETPPDDNTV